MRYLRAILVALVLSGCASQSTTSPPSKQTSLKSTSTVTCHATNGNTNPPTCYQGQFTQCPPPQFGWEPGPC